MGNCSGFCMTSNSATNQNEETIGGTQNKKVITADKVRQAYQEKDDMLLNEGAAGAAQYEEAYGRGAGNAGRLIGGSAAGGPRKLGKPNEDGAPEAAGAP